MTLFLSPTDPILNERADEVCACHIESDEMQEYMNQMIEIGAANPEIDALAAPQIGILERILLIKTEEMTIYVDPEILWMSDELEYDYEGCYSTAAIYGIVPRAKKILVRSYDRAANIAVQEFEGYAARLFQHAIDHLDGIRFPERIENDQDLHWVEQNELSEYKVHWATWQKKFPREKWTEMKNGSTS